MKSLLVALFVGAHFVTFAGNSETVGPHSGVFILPDNQIVTPEGKFVELPGVRPNALALSHDGSLLVTSGRTNELLVLDPATGQQRQTVSFPADNAAPEPDPVSPQILHPDKKAQLSLTGLVFSPDDSRIYLANVNGDIKVFAVSKDRVVSNMFSIRLPKANAPARAAEIPAGLAVSDDGAKLYACLNLANRLGEFDAKTGVLLRQWETGVAPCAVVLAGKKAYVSNWGGRQPDGSSMTGPAGRGTLVRTDARGIANEGSVSIIDLSTGGIRGELLTGLRPTGMAVSPDGHFVVAANAGSDTLSVIDTRTDKLVETICARRTPGDLFGAQPNALVFDKSGKKLYICNGTQNAVAVIRFHPRQSEWLGLIPVGWYPAAIAFDARRGQLDVANLKTFGPGVPQTPGGKIKFHTTQYYGSLSLLRPPSGRQLKKLTARALENMRHSMLAKAVLPPRPNAPARPIPERVGEPSVFKHVVYILKENCAYDQVLGDMREGNGDADLCVFGEKASPNMHRLARDFVLLDNTYCCSILSADGHEWATTGIATDYLERSFAGWPRSYPAGNRVEERDAMAYSPAGFIWDNALTHGETVRDFGEFTLTHVKWKTSGHRHEPGFLDCYRDIVGNSNAISFSSEGSVNSLRPCVETNTVGWTLDVPDIFRARQFIAALARYETNDNFPQLTILWLPHDHTSGAKYGFPIPSACVADNDLAFGRVLDALSHTRFWKDTCVFAIEDDPQNGWDHVNGFRTTAFIASPYTKRKTIIDTQYNQTSVLRTMELILGLPPMNQMDATATPMRDCFVDSPDFTPFVALSNNIPLDAMNPDPKKIRDPRLRKDAEESSRFHFEKEDQCPAELFAHILWRSVRGAREPYPASAAPRPEDAD